MKTDHLRQPIARFALQAAARGAGRHLVLGAVALTLLTLSACSGGNSLFGSNDGTINDQSKFSVSAYGVAASPRVTRSRAIRKGGGRYMVGQPYKVAGRWYRPAENRAYDETGIASWYGPNFHGRLTANGETFDQFALTGAHPTLPLPSYVRVENLSNGRSTIVRINDRGPFARDRLIDLSRRTAEVLGFIRNGTARVRVTYVGPAPLEGDDTNFLVASINTNGAPVPLPSVQHTVRNSIISRQNGGLLGAVTGAVTNLFSYAEGEQGAELINGAHAAVNQVATSVPQLDAWRQKVQGIELDEPVQLGMFADGPMALEIARRFALLGAVNIEPAARNTRKVSLSLTSLKPGVLPEDITELARQLRLELPSAL